MTTFLDIVNGENRQQKAVSTTVGAADANKLVTLNSQGLLDESLLNNPREYIRECASSIYYDFKTPADITDWVNYTGTGEKDIVNDVLKIGNNADNDQQWIVHKDLIPIEKDTLYKVSAKVRRTHGTGTIYIGIAGVKEDKTTLCNIVGHNTYSSQHYPVASLSPASEFTEYAGYFSNNNSLLASYYRNRVLHPDVVYVRPLLIANYPNKAGIVEIEWFKIEKITSDTHDLTKNKPVPQTVKTNVKEITYQIQATNNFVTAAGGWTAVPHGLDGIKIKDISVAIQLNSSTQVRMPPEHSHNANCKYSIGWDATNIFLSSASAGSATALHAGIAHIFITYKV